VVVGKQVNVHESPGASPKGDNRRDDVERPQRGAVPQFSDKTKEMSKHIGALLSVLIITK